MLEVWAQSGAWPVLWVQVVAVVVAGVSVTAICVGLPSSPLGNWTHVYTHRTCENVVNKKHNTTKLKKKKKNAQDRIKLKWIIIKLKRKKRLVALAPVSFMDERKKNSTSYNALTAIVRYCLRLMGTFQSLAGRSPTGSIVSSASLSLSLWFRKRPRRKEKRRKIK